MLSPLTVSGLQYIAGIESPAITLDYIVLLLSLIHPSTSAHCNRKLMDVYSLSSSLSRKFSVLRPAGDERFITYEEIVPGTGALFVIFLCCLLSVLCY